MYVQMKIQHFQVHSKNVPKCVCINLTLINYIIYPQFHNQPKVTLTLKFTIYHRNILLQQSIKATLR
jgi:hypothetical protein